MNKNEYRLIIDINDFEGGGNGAISKSAETDKTEKRQKAIGNLVKYQVAQPFINATKQIIYNAVETDTGSAELTQRIQIGMNVAHQTASTITYGASLGSILGIGAGTGVILGTSLAILKFGIDLLVKRVELNNKIKIENEQLSILRGRAGIQFNRSRSGE